MARAAQGRGRMSDEVKDDRVANKGMQGGDGIREVAKNAQLVRRKAPPRESASPLASRTLALLALTA